MSAARQYMPQNYPVRWTHDLEQKQLSLSPSSNYMCYTTEDDQHVGQPSKFADEPEETESTPRFSSNIPPPQEASEPSSYGIDWSDRAHPASHCWLPYLSKKSSASSLCTYISCKNCESTSVLSLVECAACSLIVHTAHISELQETTTNVHHPIPPCRPSFTDSNTTDDISMHDQHYWSHVPTLSQPCAHCRHKSLKGTLQDNSKRASITPTFDDRAAVSGSATTHVAEESDPKLSQPSSGLVCLWCSQSYHRRCWESINDDEDKNKCDYGTFGDIVVRPQWLRRVPGSPFGFRAQMPDYFETNSRSPTPVIFFINKLSGGQKGQEIYRTLVRLINPRQVFLLENDTTITQALDIYSSLSNTRVCICGGDGSVRWVLSRLVDAFPPLKNPPASIIPLGTGNDLLRVLGWGYQYTSKRLLRTCTQIPRAQPIALDRWQIQIETLETSTASNESVRPRRRFFSFMNQPKFVRDADQPLYENYHTPINTFFFNYMSFGLDAAVVLDFHAHRMLDPSKYTSPFKNKILYINESRKYFNEFAFGIAWDLSSYIRLICDGQDLTHLIRNCHSLALLNIPGFGSGTRPWGRTSTNRISSRVVVQKDDDSFDQISTHSFKATNSPVNGYEACEHVSLDDDPDAIQTMTTPSGAVARATVDHFEAQNFGDRKIEVLGFNTIQMALIHIGFRGKRIAQCSQVRIELTNPMPVHMDGEPFYLAGSTAVNITHAGQVSVLRNEN